MDSPVNRMFFRESLGTFSLTLTIGLCCWLPETRTAIMAAGLCLTVMFFTLKTKDSKPMLNPAVSFAVFCWQAINESVDMERCFSFLAQILAQLLGSAFAGVIMGCFMLAERPARLPQVKIDPIAVYPWKESMSLSNDFCLSLLATLLFILVLLRINYSMSNNFPATGPFIIGIAYSAGLYAIGDYVASGINPAVPIGLIIANVITGFRVPRTGSFSTFVAYIFATGISSVGAVMLHALVELTDTRLRQTRQIV